VTRASFLMTLSIATHNKPFPDTEFVKPCMADVAKAVCPENKTAFESISLSRRTSVCCVEEMNSNLLTQVNDTVQTLAYFSVALDDTAQLLIFIRGANDKFDVITALLYMEAMKRTTTDEDLYERVSTALERRKQWWDKIIIVTTERSSNLTGK